VSEPDLQHKLEQITARLEQYTDYCDRRIITVTEVQTQAQWADAAVRDLFKTDSPLFRIFDRRWKEHTDYWSVTVSGYGERRDCDNLRYRIDTIRLILNELDPEFLRDAAAHKTQYYFAAGEVYRSKKRILDIMRGARQQLDVVDKYLDADIFDYIDALDPELSIRLLTGSKKAIFATLLKALASAKASLQARENRACHDRFLILDGRDVWHIGTSINSAGNAAFMINKVTDDAESARVLADFGHWWGTGTIT
jgi:hypothetical protein